MYAPGTLDEIMLGLIVSKSEVIAKALDD